MTVVATLGADRAGAPVRPAALLSSRIAPLGQSTLGSRGELPRNVRNRPSSLLRSQRGPRTTALSVALALVPVIALTVGIPFANRVEPRICGMPFLPAYIALWIVLTPAFMFAVYRSEHRP